MESLLVVYSHMYISVRTRRVHQMQCLSSLYSTAAAHSRVRVMPRVTQLLRSKQGLRDHSRKAVGSHLFDRLLHVEIIYNGQRPQILLVFSRFVIIYYISAKNNNICGLCPHQTGGVWVGHGLCPSTCESILCGTCIMEPCFLHWGPAFSTQERNTCSLSAYKIEEPLSTLVVTLQLRKLPSALEGEKCLETRPNKKIYT